MHAKRLSDTPPPAGRSGEITPDLHEVFETYGAFVLRTVRRFGVRPADVQDVAQEVFLVAHRRLPEFDPRGSIRAWLLGIVRRVAADHRRKAWVRRERPSDRPPDRGAPGHQEDDLARGRARRLLDLALARLDDDKRTVFVLYELEGLPMQEITATMRTPLQTGYSRLHAARARVRQTVRELAGESGFAVSTVS